MVGTAPLLERKEKRRGMQSLYAYFGPYSRKEIEESLKILNKRIKLFYGFFFYMFLDWVRVHLNCASWSIFDFIDWLDCK